MEDEGDESPEYIDKAESSAATGSETETVLSDYQDEGEQERHVEAAVCESDDTIKKIAVKQYPTDASHVDTFHIKCNDSYISMCCSVGPSPTANSIHCFSCRLFLFEEKYKNRTEWTIDGIRKSNAALEKNKQHSITEMHMTSMVRWTNVPRQGQAFRGHDEGQSSSNRTVETSLNWWMCFPGMTVR